MALYKDKVIIKAGQVPKGCVSVSGAKNSATRLLAASTICDAEVELTGYPTNLVDSIHKQRFLESSGSKIKQFENSLIIDNSDYKCDLLDDYFYPIRTTYLLVAGQLKKSGRAYIPYPGGCNIGVRKYDMHIMVWEAFGCKVTEKENYIEVVAPEVMFNATISFPISTVGGTENALLCASIAQGVTEIINAYITPEVEDLINFLKACGVKITIEGNSYICVEGQRVIAGVSYHVLPDRIEALTWLVYGILSGGDITIHNIPFDTMEIPLKHIKDAGVDYFSNSSSIQIKPECIKGDLVHSFELACGTHPGVISDMQPFYVLLAVKALGTSRVHDFRYPERISYITELNKFLDKKISAKPGEITVPGSASFKAANAESSDLRGTMAAVLAALCAKSGVSEVSGVSMALRGYNDLIRKLDSLSVKVEYCE